MYVRHRILRTSRHHILRTSRHRILRTSRHHILRTCLVVLCVRLTIIYNFVYAYFAYAALSYTPRHHILKILLQELEKQEVDRVEFVKKQIMLYVFLKKEVNEICEKVMCAYWVQMLMGLCLKKQR